MLSRITIALALGLFSAVSAIAAGQTHLHGSVPPASFLNYHVSTVHELSQEVTLDPAVRARLATHFHISEAQMTRYVRRNLILTHLRKGGSYRVACVRRDGREYWIESYLPAGTAVFASRATGHPILKLACGNPMVSSLPPGIKIGESQSVLTPPQFASLPPPELSTPSIMPGLLTEAVAPVELAAASFEAAPPIVLVSDFPPLGSITPILGGGTRAFSGFSALPAVLGAAAIGIASTGHGGSTPQVVPPQVVPEATTSLSFGAMLLGGALFILRRKRTSKKAQ